MLMVLFMTNTPKLARFTGLFGGALVFLYITFEAPLSGMSINPRAPSRRAYPVASGQPGWIYFVAPIGGMLLAVEIYRGCAKRRTSRLRQMESRPAPALHLLRSPGQHPDR